MRIALIAAGCAGTAAPGIATHIHEVLEVAGNDYAKH